MKWTRADFEADREQYVALLATLREVYPDSHPLVERQLRRIETVDRVLSDPAYGLTEEGDSDGTADPADRGRLE